MKMEDRWRGSLQSWSARSVRRVEGRALLGAPSDDNHHESNEESLCRESYTAQNLALGRTHWPNTQGFRQVDSIQVNKDMWLSTVRL